MLKHRVRILKSYLINAIFSSKDTIPSLEQQDLEWLSSPGEDFYKQFNKDNLYTIFNQLEAQITSLKPLIIYLPFESDDNIALQIASFARTKFNNQNICLDVKYDPNLIAGCALVWNGVYKDYSLRSKIEEKKAEVLDSFKQFFR